MSLTTAFVAILVLLIAILLVRRRQDAAGERPSRPRKKRPKSAAVGRATTTKYHAVSLKFNSLACDAAKAMDGKRFLSSAAPRIPLLECDVRKCNCRFVHYRDRRTGDERRERYGRPIGGESGEPKKEQRLRRERRQEPPDF